MDDDPDQLEIRQLIMEQAGHRVVTAPSAAKALAAFDAGAFDVILMDLRLPHAEDGLLLIRRLRSRSGEVRILVLSGWPDDLRNQPEAKLVDEFLRKPIRTAHLLKIIGRVA